MSSLSLSLSKRGEAHHRGMDVGMVWNDRNTEEEDKKRGKKRRERGRAGAQCSSARTMKSVSRTTGRGVSILIDVHAHAHAHTPRDLRFFDGYSAGQKFPSLPVKLFRLFIVRNSNNN